MESSTRNLEPHTAAWNIQVWASFLVACAMLFGGTILAPIDLWARGYLIMGELFVVGSTFNLAKTVRDNHEASQMRNRITKAKADRLLKEYELTES